MKTTTEEKWSVLNFPTGAGLRPLTLLRWRTLQLLEVGGAASKVAGRLAPDGGRAAQPGCNDAANGGAVEDRVGAIANVVELGRQLFQPVQPGPRDGGKVVVLDVEQLGKVEPLPRRTDSRAWVIRAGGLEHHARPLDTAVVNKPDLVRIVSICDVHVLHEPPSEERMAKGAQ